VEYVRFLKAERNEKDSDGARMIRIRKLSDLEISTERSFLRDRRHILLIVGETKTWVFEVYEKPYKLSCKKKKREDDHKEEKNQGFL
jgi:hypothetical protein